LKKLVISEADGALGLRLTVRGAPGAMRAGAVAGEMGWRGFRERGGILVGEEQRSQRRRGTCSQGRNTGRKDPHNPREEE